MTEIIQRVQKIHRRLNGLVFVRFQISFFFNFACCICDQTPEAEFVGWIHFIVIIAIGITLWETHSLYVNCATIKRYTTDEPKKSYEIPNSMIFDCLQEYTTHT